MGVRVDLMRVVCTCCRCRDIMFVAFPQQCKVCSHDTDSDHITTQTQCTADTDSVDTNACSSAMQAP